MTKLGCMSYFESISDSSSDTLENIKKTILKNINNKKHFVGLRLNTPVFQGLLRVKGRLKKDAKS